MATDVRDKADAAEQAMRRNAEERDRRREVEAIFQVMDTDCDGYLSIPEAQRLGQMLGIAVPDRHTVNVRGISLHQFLGWVFGVQATDERQAAVEVLQYFTFMRDKKGFITRQRFRAWLNQHTVSLSLSITLTHSLSHTLTHSHSHTLTHSVSLSHEINEIPSPDSMRPCRELRVGGATEVTTSLHMRGRTSRRHRRSRPTRRPTRRSTPPGARRTGPRASSRRGLGHGSAPPGPFLAPAVGSYPHF
mmetsp:Transcript_46487/g.110771  ORF Transcript_46487/g.110771 Transcript_46487/m.110771 type:complete len:247 (-) Transcript_46487:177-917(-)